MKLLLQLLVVLCTASLPLVLSAQCPAVCVVSDITVENASPCNNNGSPNNTSDDFLFADVVVTHDLPNGCQADLTVSGLFENDQTVTFTADGDPIVLTQVALRGNTPNTLTATINYEDTGGNSVTCSLTVALGQFNCPVGYCPSDISVGNVTCDDNGTPNNPADDFVVFTLDPNGTSPFGYDVTNAPAPVSLLNGNPATNIPYGAPTTFKMSHAAAGTGLYFLTVTDRSGSSSCEAFGQFADPCSAPVCPTSVNLDNVSCFNNNTANNPNDDRITFSINPLPAGLGDYSLNLTSGGTQICINNGNTCANPRTSSYGIKSYNLGAGSIGLSGPFLFTLTDVVNPGCVLQFSFDPPPCALDNCSISNAGLNSVTCNNNGTLNSDNDDFVTFTLNPVGSGLGSSYSVSSSIGVITLLNGNPATGVPYGVATTFRGANGSADVSGTITVTDQNTTCTRTANLTAPGNCSTNTCALSSVGLANAQCNDNGTPNNDNDDFAQFSLSPVGANLSGTYNVLPSTNVVLFPSGSPAQNVPYGVATQFRLNLGNTLQTLFVRDGAVNACQLEVLVSVDPSCSANSCDLFNGSISGAQCFDNNTPGNTADDFTVFAVNPSGSALATTYSVTGPINFNFLTVTGNPPTGLPYGTPTLIKVLNVHVFNGAFQVTISDDGPSNCTDTEFFDLPATCSPGTGPVTQPSCVLQSAGLSDVGCHNNFTPFDPTDDRVQFTLNATGSGIGSTYALAASAGLTPLTRATGGSLSLMPYGVPTQLLGPVGSAGLSGAQTLTLTDNTTPACSLQVAVTPVGACATECPAITFSIAPHSVAVPCDANTAQAVADWLASGGDAVLTTPADVSVEITHNFSGLSNGCGNTGEATVNFLFTNSCGATATATALITVTDGIAPTFNPFNFPNVFECDGAGNLADIQNLGNLQTANDLCGSATVTFTTQISNQPGSCDDLVTYTFTATDQCGNTATKTAVATIEDNEPPSIVANNRTLECNAANNAANLAAWQAEVIATATDLCSAVQVGVVEIPLTIPLVCPVVSQRRFRFTATDECGNTATAEANFVLEDHTAPTVAASKRVVECDGSGNAAELAAWQAEVAASASDACGNVSVAAVEVPTSLYYGDACGLTAVRQFRFTATDQCGNSSNAEALFVTEDTTPPAFVNVPPDATGNCEDVLHFDEPDTYDACSELVRVTFEQHSDCEPGWIKIVRTWTAKDACGNTTVAVQNVAAPDSMAPKIMDVPADLTLEMGTPLGAPSQKVWVCDECPLTALNTLTFEQQVVSPELVWRIWTACDCADNCTRDTQVITLVGDNFPPQFVNLPAFPAVVECGDLNNLAAQVQAVDPPTNLPVSVTLSETVTYDNCADQHTVVCTFTATDATGLTATHVVEMLVLDGNCPPQYCTPTLQNVQNQWVEKAEFAGAVFENGTLAFADFTQNAPVEVAAGGAYELKITPGDSAPYAAVLWLDLNRDGQWDDLTERLDLGAGQGAFAGHVHLPVTTRNGLTRLRLVLLNQSAADACSAATGDAVLDFNLLVHGADCLPNVCQPSVDNSVGEQEYIAKVKFGTSFTQYSSQQFYTDYTATQTADLQRNTFYWLQVAAGTNDTYGGKHHWKVYADLNRDGDFTNPVELVGSRTVRNLQSALLVHLPAEVSAGRTVLRVVLSRSANSTDCALTGPGEVEDYGLCIVPVAADSVLSWQPVNLQRPSVDRSQPLPTAAALWPNPATEQAYWAVEMPSAGPVRCEVLDLAGRVQSDFTVQADAGFYADTLEVKGWPSGVYVVRLHAGGVVQTLRLVVAE